MSNALANKVAIVTGGAAGIGGATARQLAAGGARVLIVDIDEESAALNATRIVDEGGQALTLVGNVAEEAVAKEMVNSEMVNSELFWSSGPRVLTIAVSACGERSVAHLL